MLPDGVRSVITVTHSLYFSEAELACRCDFDCGAGPISGTLVNVLESARRLLGTPLVISSGLRCTPHNRVVGGAENSDHLTGHAADVVTGRHDQDDLFDILIKYSSVSKLGRYDGWLHVSVYQYPWDIQGRPVVWDRRS